MERRIFLSPPHMGGEEIDFVNDVFRLNWIAPVGPHIEMFEKSLAMFNQVEHCVALSSGTAAIHLSLIALGVNRGDEVVCSSFTFAGSCNPIAYLGAIPIFIDSEPETWNMSPIFLEEAIIDRIKRKGRPPKAIIVVHLYGMPAKINEILRIAEKYDIPVIEDAAESLGSKYHGKYTGTMGKIGVYSFNGNKIITTSGGGAAVSDDSFLVDRIRHLATQAREKADHYQHTEIGYNYRMSNVCAGIGLGQMRVLEDRIEKRRFNFYYYQKKLAKLTSISFQVELDGFYSNRWLTCILINSEDGSLVNLKLRKKLESENIESRTLWKPMHLQPVYKACPYYGNSVCENIFIRGICLPSGSALNTGDLDRVISVICNQLN